MKALLAFILKEFYHIFRDPRSLLIIIGMPVVQIILFGFAITNEIKEAHIAIVDPSRDVESLALTRKILAGEYFILDEYLPSVQMLERSFKRGKIKLGLVFDSDFGDKLGRGMHPRLQVITDATDPNTATTLYNYIRAIVADFRSNRHLGQPVRAGTVDVRSRMLYNARLEGVYFFVPGLITIILMLISAMMSSISLTREKEKGTMEILLVSPLKPAMIIIGKVLPYVLLSLVNGTVILLLGVYVFHVPIRGDLLLLFAEIILFIVTSLSLGIFISTKVETQQVALLISLMALMLPTIILSGFIFPIENMPLPLQIISHAIPAKWFIIIIKNIMLKGVGFSYIWKQTLVLAGMALIFIGASVKSFKTRLE